jgi:acetylornithine deacetylase/succinyl-diaminopimelate desuccinylase-like protein
MKRDRASVPICWAAQSPQVAFPWPKPTRYKDRAGLSVESELRKIGFLGDVEEKLTPPHAYLECHIEQGPVLRSQNFDIGVVTGVQSISWHELSIVGRSAHAGTTPMELRADASVAASRINLRLRDMARSGAVWRADAGDDGRDGAGAGTREHRSGADDGDGGSAQSR